MKYFRPKSGASAKGTSKRRAPEEGAGAGAVDEQPQCSAAIAQRPQDKARDPYRRKTGWKRTKKPAQPAQPEQRAEGGGDVQIGKTEKNERDDDAISLVPAEGELAAVVETQNKEQQTSATCLELDGPELEEKFSVQHKQDDDDEGGSFVSLQQGDNETAAVEEALQEGDVSARISAHLTGLASLVELADAPSEAGSSMASEDSQGIRHWQRCFLPRLNRARNKRDIRLARKEVLSLQMLMEAVLKQHMALSREVESVKANLQWEPMEPLSLSRALSRLQTERQEEAATFARTLAARDKEMHKLDRELQSLRCQMSELQTSCREKDEDIEKAAIAMATLHDMHQRTVQEMRLAEEERLEAALDKVQQARDLEMQSYEERLHRLQQTVSELQTRMHAESAAFKQSLDEKHAQLSDLTAERATREAEIASLNERLRAKDEDMEDLRAELLKVRSDHHMESLSLSRALTEKEAHIARLMANMDKLNSERSGEVKLLREEVREQERAAQALRQERQALAAEVTQLHADQEDMLVVMSKALSARDSDAASLRDQMEAVRKEHELRQQALKDDLELLRSEKDVMALTLNKTINEKDIRISDLLIDIEGLRTHLAERDARLQQADNSRAEAQLALHKNQEERAALLRSVEEMSMQQGELTGRLQRALAQIESLRQELAQQSAEASSSQRELEGRDAEVARLRKELKYSAAQRDKDAEHFRKALHEKDVQLRDAMDKFANFRKEKERELKTMKDQLDENEEKVQKKIDRVKSKAEGELVEKEAAIEILKSKLAKLQESEARIENEREALSKALQEKENEVKVLKNSVEQMKVRHKERSLGAKLDLEKKTKEVLELTKDVQHLRIALDQAKGEHRDCAEFRQRKEAELEKALRAVDKARRQNEETVSKLKQSLLEKEGLLSRMMAERSKLETEADNLRSDMAHYAKQKAGYASVIEEKDKEIAALHEKYKLLWSKMKSDNEMMTKCADDRAAETARLQSALNDANEARTALQHKFSKLFKVVRASFLKRSAERASLEEELRRMRVQAETLKGSFHAHEAERDKLNKMLLGKENEMRQLRENLHQYEAHLKETRDEMDASIETWKKRAQDLDHQVQVLQAQIERHDEEGARLQAAQEENAALRGRQQELERELQTLEAQSKIQEGEMQRLETALEENKALLEARQSLERELQRLQAQCESHEAERQRLEAARDENERLREAAQRERDTLQELEREVQKLRAQSRAHEAERQRLHVMQEENERLRKAQQDLERQLGETERSKATLQEQMDKKTSELELELELGKKIIKKHAEEYRQKTEKLQLAVENARQERDSELAVLRETVARLEAENIEQVNYCETVKEEKTAEVLSLQVALDSRQSEVERLTEFAERIKRENEQHATKEIELRQRIEYLEGDLEHQNEALAERERQIAELAAAVDSSRSDAHSQLAQKEERIVQLGGTVDALKSGLDFELLQVKTKLESSECEKRQLMSKVSMLEHQMEEHISLMARKLTERENEIQELKEAKKSLLAKYEAAKMDLTEESNGLLEVLARIQSDREQQQAALDNTIRQKDSELQSLIQTMNGALRAKDDELKKLKDAAEESESLRRQVEELEESLKLMVNSLQADGVITLKNLEGGILSFTAENCVSVLAVLKEKLRQSNQERECMEKQLREKDTEVGKLAETVEALKTDLNIQKQLLLTFHEGRAYLGAPSEHDGLSKVTPALTGIRNTAEKTILPQDGDHLTVRMHRKHAFPAGELKRTASEGDHLDDVSLDFGSSVSGATSFSDFTLGLRTPSEVSTSSHNQTAEKTLMS